MDESISMPDNNIDSRKRKADSSLHPSTSTEKPSMEGPPAMALSGLAKARGSQGQRSGNFQRSKGGRDGRTVRGGRGGRASGREKGRAEWNRNPVDKRARNEAKQHEAKLREANGVEQEILPIYATKFSQEEINAQERKPKRKVAVMIGYSGSGYKGMQLNHSEKTIEGDLFSAFVAAGAISKANADDPKKSSLVRCARTDKGVHAAGNVISLKLVIEDPHVVAKINAQLSPQIRVWGIERTNGAFSAYQTCDSRIYEYLIPTHCFLPPQPRTFLGRQMEELAREADDVTGYQQRQDDTAGFWADVELKHISPILGNSDPELASKVLEIFYESSLLATNRDVDAIDELNRYATSILESTLRGTPDPPHLAAQGAEDATSVSMTQEANASAGVPVHEATPLELLFRHLKDQSTIARKSYRISSTRLARVRSTLSRFVGVHKFHNYTIDKTAKDASATRIIKSFVIGSDPLIIGDTEWLSLKVHGQSFMMHQIRKMVSLAALVVRTGCHEGRIQDTYDAERISIPKAPSLGLLLERPVFDEYNKKLAELGREKVDFGRYETEMNEFKQREIYERIFREEERDRVFHAFFTGLDHTRSAQLLYLSSLGLPARERNVRGDVDQSSGAAPLVTAISGKEGNPLAEKTDSLDPAAKKEGMSISVEEIESEDETAYGEG